MRCSPYLFLIQTLYLLKEPRNLSRTRVLLDYPVKPGPRPSQLLALSDRNGLDMISFTEVIGYREITLLPSQQPECSSNTKAPLTLCPKLNNLQCQSVFFNIFRRLVHICGTGPLYERGL